MSDQSERMAPADVLWANEEFIRALEAKASKEVIEHHIGKDFDVLQLKYLFLCQMLASHTSVTMRGDWNLKFIKMLARDHGVDT